jgi:hypothetical protein
MSTLIIRYFDICQSTAALILELRRNRVTEPGSLVCRGPWRLIDCVRTLGNH